MVEMARPLVSVLIPCYNAAPYIAATLESVLAQTWRPLEIIVVDDGSTDSSAEVVSSFESRGIKLLRQSNCGAAAARNLGIAASTGDLIQFLDADDIIDPEKIQLQLRRLQNSPSSVASAEWGRFYDFLENTSFVPEVVWRDMGTIDWLVASREDGGGMMFPALWLIPRHIVHSAGPWKEELSLADDTEYFTRVLLHADSVLFCPGARCRYRSGIYGSLSGRKSQKAWRSQFNVTELCESYVREREDSERVRRGFAISWQHFAYGCYPYDSALAGQALQRAYALHAVRSRPGGGPVFKALARVAGWRVARRLQVLIGRP